MKGKKHPKTCVVFLILRIAHKAMDGVRRQEQPKARLLVGNGTSHVNRFASFASEAEKEMEAQK